MHQTLSAPPPKVDAQEAAELTLKHFGLPAAHIKELVAERDQNLFLQSEDGRKWVVKLSNPNEDPGLTDFQTEALVHLGRAGGDLPLPKLLFTRDGAASAKVTMRDGRASVLRLLSWVEGVPLSQARRSTSQRQELAVILARLGQAFRGFSHPAQSAYMQWDITHLDRIAPLLPHVPGDEMQVLVAGVLQDFVQIAKPQMAQLRRQVIYNDLNPFNVLVDGENPDRIAGIIDFGDITAAPLINDLAVAAAYQFGPGGRLEEVAEFVAGYAAVEPLRPEELRLLPLLIAARLSMTLLISGYRAGLHPENAPYILRNAEGSRAALARLRQDSLQQQADWIISAVEDRQ